MRNCRGYFGVENVRLVTFSLGNNRLFTHKCRCLMVHGEPIDYLEQIDPLMKRNRTVHRTSRFLEDIFYAWSSNSVPKAVINVQERCEINWHLDYSGRGYNAPEFASFYLKNFQ